MDVALGLRPLMVILALGIGCGGGGGEIGDDAATDTGPDAVAVDAGLDAADAATDTGVDAGTCTTDGDCLDGVSCTSSTELTTQTFICSGGVCVEDASSMDDCAAADADTCATGVVSTRGTCDASMNACVTSTSETPCASPMCDVSEDYVTETCVEAGGTASCVPATNLCMAGSSTTCRGTTPTLFELVRGCNVDGCTSTNLSTACAASAPACLAGPSYVTYSPGCDPTGSACEDVVDTTTRCRTRPNSCIGGDLTSSTATCDSAGCGETASTAPCAVAPSACEGTRAHTTYAPLCSSRATCDPVGTPTTINCLALRPRCSGTDFIFSTATCDDATGCGMASTTTDCTDHSTCLGGTWSLRYGGGICTLRGCTGTSQTMNCVAGGSVCTSATTSRTCTGGGICGRSGCTGCVSELCRLGCNASTGLCL